MRVYLVGPLLLLAATIPVVYAAWYLAGAFVRSALPRLTLAWFLAVAEMTITVLLTGMLGLWNAPALLVGAWVVAGAVAVLAMSIGSPPEPPASLQHADEPEAPREDGWEIPRWIRALAVGAPIGIAVAAFIAALAIPDTGNDAMLYHHQMLAHWLGNGTFWKIPSLENGPAYEGGYWSNGDAFSLWWAIPYGRDFLVQLSSLVWAAGAWLAAACIARTLGLGRWTSVVTASAVLVSFGALGGQLATMHVDVYTLFACAVMVWASLRWLRGTGTEPAHPDSRAGWLGIAGLAAGLAVGSKVFALALCVLWCGVVAVVAVRRGRAGAALWMLFAAFVVALPWPLRALVATGSPLWPFGAGPFEAPESLSRDGMRSIAGLARDEGPGVALGSLIAGTFIGYGLLPLLLLLRIRRMWAWAKAHGLLLLGIVVPVISLVVYVVSPGTGQFPGQVAITQRFYAAVMLILVAVLGAATLTAGDRISRRTATWLGLSMAVSVVIVLVAQSFLVFTWPVLARVAGVAAGVYAGWRLTRGTAAERRSRGVLLGTAVAVGVLVLVSVAGPLKAANWFPYHTNLTYMDPVNDWLHDENVHGANIAYAGVFPSSLSGDRLDNHAYWLGMPSANDGMQVWTDRDEWEQALQAACTDYLVVGSVPSDLGADLPVQDAPFRIGWGRDNPEWEWSRTSPILDEIHRDDVVAIYRVEPDPGQDGCDTPD